MALSPEAAPGSSGETDDARPKVVPLGAVTDAAASEDSDAGAGPAPTASTVLIDPVQAGLHPEGRSHAERAPDDITAERRYLPGRGWTKYVPRALSILFFIVAIVSLIGALIPPVRRGDTAMREVLAALVLDPTPNLAWAALMFILASSLRKRKRAAWWLLLLIEAASVITAIVELVTHDQASYPTLVLVSSATVLVVLLLSQREFFAIVQRGSLWRAIVTFLIGGAIAFALGWGLVSVFPGTVPAGDQGLWVINELLGSIGEPSETGLAGVPPHWVGVLVGLMGAIVYVATAWVFFRPRTKDVMLAPEQEVAVRELLVTHGDQDSLGYFATRRDKSAAFSPSGKAAVTYRVLSGVSLASGDPIGDPEAWPGAIEQWLEEARHHAWSPAVMGASEAGAEAYMRAGLSALELGDEAIIEFHGFDLHGRSMRQVRQAVNKVERAGYTARVRRHADISDDEMKQIIAAADRWRDTDNERGFSMALGRLGDPADGRCVLVEALDADGRLKALLSFSPWGERGLSLDLMRRSRTAENGVMEFMVTQLIEAGPRIGVDRLSLNFAVLRSVFEEGAAIGAGPVIRSTRAVLIFASRWWQLESLYRSNAKYDPEWRPRFILFDSAGDIPRVAIASAVAEGFVDPPSPKGWFRRAVKGESPLAAAASGSPVELIAAAEAARAEQASVSQAAALADPWAELPEQERVRREKLAELRESGYDPYASSFARTHAIGQVRTGHPDLEPDRRTGDVVKVAGRVVLNREGGKLCFATVRDFTGDIQLMISLDGSGEDVLARWKNEVDLGDHVGVTGEVVTTRRGELSILVSDFLITSKCLVPLPDKHKGLTDPEARVRQRYVDLIVNPEARELMELRSTAVRSVRESLWKRGYLEVETPMLQAIHGGANARPFTTHINAYDMNLYLRIAPELYLKRLLVGGADRVFELNRNFRNEGADSTHNPEFTSLEMYDAYGNYDVMADLTRDIILEAATAVYGRPVVRRPREDGEFDEVDISAPWKSITVHEAISEALGEEVTPGTSLTDLRRFADQAGVPYDPTWDAAHVTLELYEHLCEDRTEMPTFYRDFPTEVSPLTRRKPSDPRLAERWDLVAWGAELGTAYTELIDPIDQRERLTQQSLLAAAGDAEAMEVDEDFLRALEYGMPPAGGQGMGIDRLVMLLTGRNIRETVLFPLVRPD